jgi:AcrR family transcriptional regulator
MLSCDTSPVKDEFEGDPPMPATDTAGRAAQRRRTRKGIVEATMELLAKGVDPSVNDIAAAADVSRRTVYLHFPTLDQLILDATLGLMNLDIDDAMAEFASDDPAARLEFLVGELAGAMEEALPLGRRLIKLTVGGSEASAGPRRGHRRVGWLEWAVEPLRGRLSEDEFADLVSALATVIGWESFIVLTDIRGVDAAHAHAITRRSALALLAAATGDTAATGASSGRARRRRVGG